MVKGHHQFINSILALLVRYSGHANAYVLKGYVILPAMHINGTSKNGSPIVLLERRTLHLVLHYIPDAAEMFSLATAQYGRLHLHHCMYMYMHIENACFTIPKHNSG